ncbi:hypothetical protein C8F04DRAFT_1252281 [Mycena alexandri]|uniref:Uncharacterized protein n=1 Tax=Mycena alexandri TaxID=1745969 RepID=A0AAD6TC53_9AGAR|nr:hypothetical protein C8F04DRAFT_1252281 [Mycena alexandri]
MPRVATASSTRSHNLPTGGKLPPSPPLKLGGVSAPLYFLLLPLLPIRHVLEYHPRSPAFRPHEPAPTPAPTPARRAHAPAPRLPPFLCAHSESRTLSS